MNLPNKLTMLRVILVPFFMFFAAGSHIGTSAYNPVFHLVAGVIFAAASFTDFLDGYIALADKCLTTAAFVYMMADGLCHPVVLALVMFREFAVAGVRMIAAERGTVIAANIWGKVKTVLQMLTILFYYIAPAFLRDVDVLGFGLVVQGMCWLVALVTVLSGGIYLWQNRSCFASAK